jgi:RNA polymerase sigma-70 factor (ECF subfamily)
MLARGRLQRALACGVAGLRPFLATPGDGPRIPMTAPQTTLERIAAGDAGAVAECLERFGGLVWSIARRLAGDAAEAEEVVQEVFVDLWKSAERFDPGRSSETAFVAMIARRRAIDRRRKLGRRQPLEELVAEPPHPASDEGFEAVEVRDEARRASAALAELRPEQQRVLKLSIFDGLTHEEIAVRAGMPLGTVKTHARRGLIRLRELLGQGDREEVGR